MPRVCVRPRQDGAPPTSPKRPPHTPARSSGRSMRWSTRRTPSIGCAPTVAARRSRRGAPAGALLVATSPPTEGPHVRPQVDDRQVRNALAEIRAAARSAAAAPPTRRPTTRRARSSPPIPRSLARARSPPHGRPRRPFRRSAVPAPRRLTGAHPFVRQPMTMYFKSYEMPESGRGGGGWISYYSKTPQPPRAVPPTRGAAMPRRRRAAPALKYTGLSRARQRPRHEPRGSERWPVTPEAERGAEGLCSTA